jgi:hypothetical protein
VRCDDDRVRGATFHSNISCGMKNSGPGFKAAAGMGCTHTLRRVVDGKFIESTSTADHQQCHLCRLQYHTCCSINITINTSTLFSKPALVLSSSHSRHVAHHEHVQQSGDEIPLRNHLLRPPRREDSGRHGGGNINICSARAAPGTITGFRYDGLGRKGVREFASVVL